MASVNAFLDWRRSSTREIVTKEVRSLSPELLRRVELLETQNLQIMQGLQAVLQALEDERAKREGMEGALAGWAETHLQKRAG